MPEIVIRESQLSDYQKIYSLLQQLWPGKELHPEKVRMVFERGIRSPIDKYYSAERDGGVVGFCSILIKNSFWQEGYSGYVNELVVDQPFRGQGIGTALINRAFEYAASLDCKRIEMDSAFSREGARQFYEDIGFTKRAFLYSKDL